MFGLLFGCSSTLKCRNKHVSPHLQPVFCLMKLALGWMPIFTRRSRAGTLQIVSTRLSKKWTLVYFCLDTLLRRERLARKVWRQCVLVFSAAWIFGLLAGFCKVTRRTQGRSPFHQCPRSRTATLGLGAAALSSSYVGLTVHRAVSVRRSTTGR